MSYPRNAASPPTVTLGAIVQISDGAVQTSGASVRVKTGTGAWGAGSGTLACDSTSGIWTYLPTQAETDDTHFSVAAYKTGCVPVGATVITSASATAGYAGVDWAKVANPTTTLGLTGTTIAPTQKVDVETIKTQSVTCAASVTVSPYVGSTGAAVNGTTVNTLASHDPGATIGTSTLDAAGVRNAIGLAAANLDAQLDALPTASEVATAVAAIDIDGKSLQAATRIVAAIVTGLVSGAGTPTETFVGLDGVTVRAVITADASGNRTAATYS